MASEARSTLPSLEHFKLTGVKHGHTRRHLGQGAYGYVEEYTYRELKCAGKKLTPALRESTTTKDEEKALYENAARECVTLSGLKHPNIVQFLGVHFEDDDPVPILIMEYVPYTLSGFVEKHKESIPPEITYGVLVDVARALCYLHGGDEIIIHRDLSANNILLTLDLTAKVSDLGTARILNVSIAEKIERCKRMTKCPGTPVYMPLEACSDVPSYDETLDCFSYGVLILHILTGEWPVPSEKISDEGHQVVVMNDIDRRRQFIEMIDENHPLIGLVYNCLDHKSRRPSAKSILKKVEEVQKQCCKPQVDRMTLLIQQRLTDERKAVLEVELSHLKDEKKRLELLQSEEVKEKTTKIEEVENENVMLRSLVEVRNTEQKALEKRAQSKDELCRKKEDEISALKQEINSMKKQIEEEMQAYRKKKDEEMLVYQKEKDEDMQAYQKQKDEDMQAYQKQKDEDMRAYQRQKDDEMQAHKKQKDDEMQAYKKQKDDEMNAKEEEMGVKMSEITAMEEEINDYRESLAKKERIIDEVIRKNNERAHEDLHRSHCKKGPVMEYLRSGTQMHPLHHRVQRLKWRDGPRLPTGMTAPQCILINSSLYVGGGQTLPVEKDYRSLIFEFDTRNGGKWNSPFPQCPTVYFGLGEINGKLVVVGGEKEIEDKKMIITGEVLMLDEKGTKWSSNEIPAMKKPRIRSCVVSFKGCIAACGGMEDSENDGRECSSTVEIYQSGSKEWCTVTPLPVPRAALRVSVIHKTAYFLGGFYPTLTYPGTGKRNCISIELEDLFQADKSSPRKWDSNIRDCPHESSTPASLCGSLIALGGSEGQLSQTNSIYAYSPAVKQWYLIDWLPDGVYLSSATCITLASGELVVLGGRMGGDRNTNVYIGSLE